jgi:(2Fe-2S) ferredoxin
MGKSEKREKYLKKLGKQLGRRRSAGLELVVCTDDRKGGCAERGAKHVLRALRHELARLGLDDGSVCLRACEHFGPCKHGPHLYASSGEWHSRVSPDDVPGILQRLLQGEDLSPLLVDIAA